MAVGFELVNASHRLAWTNFSCDEAIWLQPAEMLVPYPSPAFRPPTVQLSGRSRSANWPIPDRYGWLDFTEGHDETRSVRLTPEQNRIRDRDVRPWLGATLAGFEDEDEIEMTRIMEDDEFDRILESWNDRILESCNRSDEWFPGIIRTNEWFPGIETHEVSLRRASWTSDGSYEA